MKFFIPNLDETDFEDIYKAIRKFVSEQMGKHFTLTNRRIFSIRYKYQGKILYDEVNKLDPLQNETVYAILEALHAYIICTTNRGVLIGTPMFVDKREILEITDFEI